MLHLLRRRSSILICICLFGALAFRSLFASIKIQSSKLSVTEDPNKLNLNNLLHPNSKHVKLNSLENVINSDIKNMNLKLERIGKSINSPKLKISAKTINKLNEKISIVQGQEIGEKTSEEEDPRFKIVHPTVNTTTATSRKPKIEQVKTPVKPVSKAQILMEVGNLVGDKTLHFCPLFFINFMRKNNPKLNEPELSSYKKVMCKIQKGKQCKTENLQGPLKVNKTILSMEWIQKNELSFVNRGGWYMPTGCNSGTRTAIIIPFRNREQHLPVMLRQLHAVLRRQQIHYRIFVIEQSDEHPFNRGKIRNIGFKEALRYFPYTCFVFHDVDLVPENDRIFYDCRQSPAHMSVAVDTLGYMPLQYEHFGGVVSTTKAHFELANGYSNIFWQWGGEDDNVSHRLRKNGLKIHRQPKNVARYKMLSHTPAKREVQLARTIFWTEATKYGDIDGLNSLNYRLLNRTDELLFTRIQVDVLKKVF